LFSLSKVPFSFKLDKSNHCMQSVDESVLHMKVVWLPWCTVQIYC